MKKKRYIYEVWHDGPCGCAAIGFFTSKKKAEKCKADWDKKHDHAWDKAGMARRELDAPLWNADGSNPSVRK